VALKYLQSRAPILFDFWQATNPLRELVQELSPDYTHLWGEDKSCGV
jgi:hypothetical protein